MTIQELANLRNEPGFTAKEVAWAAGLSVSTVTRKCQKQIYKAKKRGKTWFIPLDEAKRIVTLGL